MTGPMKFSNFCGLPTLILATSSRILALNPPASHREEDTYSRDSAEHFWPIDVLHQWNSRSYKISSTLVLESTTHTLQCSVLDISRGMNDVEILSALASIRSCKSETNIMHTCFSNNSRISLVILQIQGNVLPKLFEDVRASSKVQSSKIRAGNRLSDHLSWRAWYELDDARRDASFCEDLVHDVVGVCGCWGGFP